MLTSDYAASQQAGNGVTLAFSFSFKILASTDLLVYKIDAAGTQSAILALGTDYTVSFDPIAETGTVTYTTAPVAGGYALIERSTDISQETSLPREGPMPAKTVETMIDKLTMIAQELSVGTVVPAVEQSGLFSARPAAPTAVVYYYSTDRGSYEKWVPAASRWFLLGAMMLGLLFGGAPKAQAGIYYDLQQTASSATLKVGGVVKLSSTVATAPTITIDGISGAINAISLNNPSAAAYYGITPSATSTMTARIQLAINSSTAVYFPAGTYLIDNTIKFGSSTQIIGAGKDATFFRYTGSTVAFVTVSTGVRTYSQYFANFTVITGTASGTTAFLLDSVSRSNWSNVVADGFGVGWDIYSPIGGYSVYNRFWDCMAQNIGRVNVSTGGVGAYLHGNSSNANKFYNFRANNFTYTGTSTGAWIANSNENMFEGSQFETNNAGVGVWLTANRDSLTDSNVIAFTRFEMTNSTGIVIGADVGGTQVHGNYPTGTTASILDSGYATNIMGGNRSAAVNGTVGAMPQFRVGKAIIADSFVAGSGVHSYDPTGCVIVGSSSFNGCGSNFEVEGTANFGQGVYKSTFNSIGSLTLALGANLTMSGATSPGFSRFFIYQNDNETQFPAIEMHKGGTGDLMQEFQLGTSTWLAGVVGSGNASYNGHFVIGPGSRGDNTGTWIFPSTAAFVDLRSDGLVRLSTLVVTSGLTASSGSFTASGNTQYSVVTTSGVNVGAGVVASFFVGNGAGLTGITSGDITSVNAGALVNGPLASSILPSTVAYTSIANTFTAAQSIQTVSSTMTIQGNAFSVGASTFVVSIGSVGINTASPQSVLDVNGGATIRGQETVVSSISILGASSFAGAMTLTNAAAATYNSSATFNSLASFKNTISSQIVANGYDAYSGGSTNNGIIKLGTSDGTDAILDWDGNGASKLKIINTVSGAGSIDLVNTLNNAAITSLSASRSSVSAFTSTVTVTSGGRMGINRTAPTDPLEITWPTSEASNNNANQSIAGSSTTAMILIKHPDVSGVIPSICWGLDNTNGCSSFIGMKLNGNSNENGELLFGTNSNYTGRAVVRFQIKETGILVSSSTAPSFTCNAGTPVPEATSTANAGTFVAGTSAANCTVTFATAWPSTPHCVVTDDTSLVAVRVSARSSSAITIAGTTISGDTISYLCWGAVSSGLQP